MKTPLPVIRIGLLSVSDRAYTGIYLDKGVPALKDWLSGALRNPVDWHALVVADEQDQISTALRALVDETGCHLVFTTGGTGPAPRDVTPEATLAVADRVLPGFGEQMRQIGQTFVPTAILSRQMAVIRARTLVVNLPGQPKAIAETLGGNPNTPPQIGGIFAAIPYCVDLIGGPYIETDETVCTAFRPRSAQRPVP